MPTYRRTFPGRPDEIHKARVWIRHILAGDPRTDDAVLIVSELGTNAVTHTASARGSWGLTVDYSPAGPLRVSVTDSGTTDSKPHVRTPDAATTSGRGLRLVGACAATVRVHGDATGRTVTAELPTPTGRPSAAQPC